MVFPINKKAPAKSLKEMNRTRKYGHCKKAPPGHGTINWTPR